VGATLERAEATRSEWLLAELSRPAAYPFPVSRVEVRRTLVSLLFFAGERVYKLKQELRLAFIDAGTLARRRFLCAEELRLNARLAPGVHLGLVPVTRGPDGHLVFGGAGEPPEGEIVEWAVEMRRLPQERMLARLLEHGVLDNEPLNELVALLSAFHAEAPVVSPEEGLGGPAAIGAHVAQNFEELAAFLAPDAPVGVLTPGQHAFLQARARGFLADQRELLQARLTAGHVREGHGDLHAENVCRLPERCVIYDRLEFDRGLRCLDVADELAFLAMDLDFRGFPGAGAYLLHRYAAHTGDAELARLSGFYKGYRAVVRAKVAALAAAAEAPASAAREALRRESMRYVQLALGYELPPQLVLLCGLPASGKTFLASGLARALRAALVHSDELRKRLAGVDPETSAHAAWGQGLYTLEQRQHTYRELLADALRALASGRSAVVDASFARREFRAPFVAAARRLGLPFCFVQLTAPEAVVRARLAERRGGASDADLEIYLRERDAFEPLDEVPAGRVLALDTSAGAPEDASSRVFERLLELRG